MSGSLPRHSNTSRPHSQSVSLSATNSGHRINRRKSVNASAASAAAVAVAAALREQGDASAVPASAHRRSMGSRKALESASMGTSSGAGAYFPRTASGVRPNTMDHNLAHESIEDEAVDETTPAEKELGSKARNRRASEGSYLVKGEGKRVSSELRCDQCGKNYKHSSCLTKHLYVFLSIHSVLLS